MPAASKTVRAHWKRTTLGEMFDIGSSKRVLKSQWKKSGVPFYRAREIVRLARDGVVDNDLFISEDHFQSLSNAGGVPQAGDLMVSAVGTLGACYEVREGDRFYYKDASVLCFRPRVELAPRFMEFAFLSDGLLSRVNSGQGATVGTFTITRARQTEFLLPQLDEQKRIVAILDQAFAALDRARAHAEANLADARALFDSVLVTTFDDLLPQSEMMTLARAAKDFSRGKSRHRPRNAPELYGGRYPFIQTGDIRRSEGSIREFSQTYSEVGLAQSKLWPVGTVCITIAANIAETGVMEFEGCFPDSVIGMVPDPEVADPYYVEYMLRYFAEELKQKGKGAAQDNINLATFESALFPFPSREKQRVVVEKLDGIAAYTKQARRGYEQAVAGIAALRQSLLQQAFSGRL